MADGTLGGWTGPTTNVGGQTLPLIDIKPGGGGNLGGANLSAHDVDALIRTTAAEAGNQGPKGQQAVAHVILNRSGNTGKSPSDIVSQPGQFEGYDNGNAAKITPNSNEYKAVANNISGVINGQIPDPTNGATHFYAPKAQAELGRSAPAWAKGEGQQIGDHVFYNNVDGEHSASNQITDDDLKGATQVVTQGSVGVSVQPENQITEADLVGAKPVSVGNQPPSVQHTPGYIAALASAKQNPNFIGSQLAGALHGIPIIGMATDIPGAHDYINSALNGFANHGLPVVQGATNAIGTVLGNMFNKHPKISGREAYQAGRDASQQALSSYGQQHPLLNTAADLGGQVAQSALIPEAKGLGLGMRLLQGAAKVGGQSALTGAGGTASEGGSAQNIAKSAAVNGALGVALSPVGELGQLGAGAFRSAAGKTAARILIPSAIGAGVSGGTAYQATKNPVDAAKAAIVGSALFGAPGLAKSKTAQTILAKVVPQEDKAAALMHIIKVLKTETPEGAATSLEASPGKTVVEALHPEHREALMQDASELNHRTLEDAQQVIAARQHPMEVKGRLKGALEGVSTEHNSVDNLKNGIEASGLPHPDTAQMDYVEHLENQHNTVARPEWAKIAEDEPLYSDQHQKLLGEPEVREAMSRARHNLGPAAETANPNYVPSVEAKTPETITTKDIQDYIAAHKTAENSLSAPLTPNHISEFINKRDNLGSSNEPETVPTAKAWIDAQKHLESEVARNDFTGKVEPDIKSSVGNWRRSQLSRELNELNKSTIDNLSEAKAASGDVISGRENAIKGANLGNKAGQSWQEHRANFEKLDEGDKQAQRFGYAKQMSRDFSRINPETGDGLDTFINKYSNEDHTEIQKTLLGEDKANQLQQSLYNTKLARAIDKLPIESGNIKASDLSHLEKLLNSESEQKLQNKIYGKEKAEQIRSAIRQEIELAKQGEEIAGFKGKQAKESEPLNTILSGAFGGMSQIGGGAAGVVKGALTGAGIAKNYQIAKHAADVIKQGNLTPGARQYLGQVLAKPTTEAAAEIRQTLAQKRNMQMSKANLASKVGHAGALVAATSAGKPLAHALSNVNDGQ